MSGSPASLDDKYTLERGIALMSGTQALVRLLLEQRRRDAVAGLDTAGYVTGYRGSPLGTYDQQLWAAHAHLDAARVKFVPGVNEDLAATAVWGTQQVALLPGAKHAGVFALWYGKGPGIDRSGDPIKHGNRMGSAPLGGVVLAFGDDHAGKSSTVSHQSEQALAACGVPVLYPASVQEILEYGLHAFALSRCAGVWVGLKCVNETVESTATVELGRPLPIVADLPDAPLPPGGVHARLGFDPMGDEVRLARHKLPRAQAFARANALDRTVLNPSRRRLGIVTAGKSYLDVEQALATLGLDAKAAEACGIGLYKVAMIWPLEPQGLREFAAGFDEVLVVEEKAPVLEPQVAQVLYNLDARRRPRLAGKDDPHGAPLLPGDVPLEPVQVALALASRLATTGDLDAALQARVAELREATSAATVAPAPVARTPYFCSGCPHNTSTRVPDGSLAFSGIGCHTMALHMERATLPPTQMGGEGLTWAGIAPFSSLGHVFQNLGDGTYFHSGLLAVRAAVAAGVNVTYKILVNDAVAMTGGQPVEGHLSVGEISRQLAAERVKRIAVVHDPAEAPPDAASLAPGTTVHERRELARVQEEMRAVPGVSAIIYVQACAAEKRRRRKRRKLVDPAVRAFINERVCEGCGDCSVQSNCVSVEPLETDWGRKRRIDQSSCNKDFSCVQGFCPSFVLVRGAGLRKRAGAKFDATAFVDLPEPPPSAFARDACNVLVTGIGGTGVVTVGSVLAMAARLEGRGANVFDMTGLAQKGGAVLSHLRLTPAPGASVAPRIGLGEADVLLGCDLVVTAGSEVLRTIARGRTCVALSTHLTPTAQFQTRPDFDFRGDELRRRIEAAAGADAVDGVEAATLAERLLGDSIGANFFMVGFAWQRGWLPLRRESIEQALQLNGVAVQLNLAAFTLGRVAAHDPVALTPALSRGVGEAAEGLSRGAGEGDGFEALVERRARFLTEYQDPALAERFRALALRAREAERTRVPGAKDALALAVARTYARLLAIKDEYEVARLYTDGEFARALDREFEAGARVSVLLAPPLLARRDPVTGVPRKREFGPWVFPLLKVLARLRRLRGRWYDPFGHTEERRSERRLVQEYEALVAELLAGLSPENHAAAVELAGLDAGVRGYGHVKARNHAAVQAERARRLAAWRTLRSPEMA